MLKSHDHIIDKRQVQGSELYLMNVEIIQKHEDASIEQNQLLNHGRFAKYLNLAHLLQLTTCIDIWLAK
jgi:hypothetical protein